MGFWGRVKDVLVSGPTTAVKNERVERTVDRAKEAAGEAADKVRDTVNPGADRAEKPADVPPPPTDAAVPTEPAATDAAEPEYRTYTVKSGDTLSEIAASYGVDWREMARLNNLENPDLIYPGQVFKVPNN